MKGDIERETIFHIIIMLIVIYIGLALVLGLNPLAWTKKGQISQLFEPGSLYITDENGLRGKTDVACGGTFYTLKLDGPAFGYKGDAGEGKIEFVIVLDYKNILFTGHYGDAEEEIISCAPPEGAEEFDCPQELEIKFDLRGVSTPQGEQTFHFTAWKARPAVIDAVKQNGATLDKVLDAYPDSYMSSFDVTVNVDDECREEACGAQSIKDDCKAMNSDGCYWSEWFWIESCELCPSSTDCNDYSSDQCGQCPIARANCKPGVLYGCKPIGD